VYEGEASSHVRLISRSHKGLEGKGGGEWRVSVVETGQALRVQVLSDKQGFGGDLGWTLVSAVDRDLDDEDDDDDDDGSGGDTGGEMEAGDAGQDAVDAVDAVGNRDGEEGGGADDIDIDIDMEGGGEDIDTLDSISGSGDDDDDDDNSASADPNADTASGAPADGTMGSAGGSAGGSAVGGRVSSKAINRTTGSAPGSRRRGVPRQECFGLKNCSKVKGGKRCSCHRHKERGGAGDHVSSYILLIGSLRD
jgi:hypothetical protein